jgi:DNA polymerase elongation subunit (family B)
VKKGTEPVCIHRHSIRSHPKCFKMGLIKVEKEQPKYLPKILMLDIETSLIKGYFWGLWEQNISIAAIEQDWHLLCWSAKWLFSDVIMSDALTPEEASRHDDKRISQSIWELVNEADIVVGHNTTGFDVRRLNTRFLYHNIMPPKAFQDVDTLKVVKDRFDLTSRKLDYVNEFLGLPKKEPTDFDLWRKCTEGDADSLKRMQEYNKNDVSIVEDTYLRIRPWIRGHPNLNLWSEDNVSRCPNCGSDKLNWGGYYYTYTGRYKAFRCENCTAVGRSRVMDLDLEKRRSVVR